MHALGGKGWWSFVEETLSAGNVVPSSKHTSLRLLFVFSRDVSNVRNFSEFSCLQEVFRFLSISSSLICLN